MLQGAIAENLVFFMECHLENVNQSTTSTFNVKRLMDGPLQQSHKPPFRDGRQPLMVRMAFACGVITAGGDGTAPLCHIIMRARLE
jgi:hypothetical protein